ncbi:uncharacterized protein [Phyllobates terribilis]|uniref:uncharacterized protein n=1 Tax=Phyllobates terribilis TaxID=111132 RepID=UPI003CCB31FC
MARVQREILAEWGREMAQQAGTRPLNPLPWKKTSTASADDAGGPKAGDGAEEGARRMAAGKGDAYTPYRKTAYLPQLPVAEPEGPPAVPETAMTSPPTRPRPEAAVATPMTSRIVTRSVAPEEEPPAWSQGLAFPGAASKAEPSTSAEPPAWSQGQVTQGAAVLTVPFTFQVPQAWPQGLGNPGAITTAPAPVIPRVPHLGEDLFGQLTWPDGRPFIWPEGYPELERQQRLGPLCEPLIPAPKPVTRVSPPLEEAQFVWDPKGEDLMGFTGETRAAAAARTECCRQQLAEFKREREERQAKEQWAQTRSAEQKSRTRRDPRAADRPRTIGTVIKFNAQHGWGFIRDRNTMGDVFVTRRDVESHLPEGHKGRDLYVGDEVTFTRHKCAKGPYALHVHRLTEEELRCEEEEQEDPDGSEETTSRKIRAGGRRR